MLRADTADRFTITAWLADASSAVALVAAVNATVGALSSSVIVTVRTVVAPRLALSERSESRRLFRLWPHQSCPVIQGCLPSA